MLLRPSICIFLAIFSGFAMVSGQTTLEPGDLAIVGINANTFACGFPAGSDEVSFVCFRDIATNTTIDITDNGWERLNAGLWGDTEGTISLTRTGPAVLAGTVITIHFLNGGYNVVSPDNNWTITDLNPPYTVNLNASGDQLYFMQGGTWTNPPGMHDATYDGNILFGFNTLSVWMADGTTQQSNLHPQVTPCFHMEPTSGVTDYIKYTSPLTLATQLEWINRIRDAANWASYSDCPAYQGAAPDYAGGYVLPVESSGISVTCTVCSNCAPFGETLVFNLPVTGGPFDVIYSDGTNTYTLNGIDDGHTEMHTIDQDTNFFLVSVTDLNGCPVFSNFEGEANITVIPAPDAGDDNSFYVCHDAVPFDLTDSLGGTPDPGGSWSPVLASGSNIYDPAVDGEGSFIYTVSGGSCPDSSATATVSFLDLTPSTIVVTCNDNGTPADDTDDIISIDFTPMGQHLGSDYTVSVSQGVIMPGSGVYGVLTNFLMQPGSAGMGDVVLYVTDNAEPFCAYDFVISDPGTCSSSCDPPPMASISGGGDICVANCPEDPAMIAITFSGGEEPYTIELNVQFPPLPPVNFPGISLNVNEEISICVEGNLPSYDPTTQTLTLPESLAGLSGSITLLGFSDNTGCEGVIGADEISLAIFDNPSITDPNIEVCSSESTDYDLTQWNDIINQEAGITWYNGDPDAGGIMIADPVHADLTQVNVLWVIADDGTCASTEPLSLSILMNPSASDPSPEICEDVALSYDLTSLNQVVNPSANIQWYLGDPLAGGSAIADPTNFDLSILPAVYALVVQEPCSTVMELSYDVFPLPDANPVAIGVCASEALNYDLTVHNSTINNNLPVLWYDGEPGSGGQPVVSPETTDLSGLSMLWAYVANDTCDNAVAITLTIMEEPMIQPIFISVCSNESGNVDLTGYDQAINPVDPVTWFNGEPGNGGVAVPDPVNADLTTILSLWVMVDNGNCSVSGQIPFDIIQNPDLELTEPASVCAGESIDLSVLPIVDLNGGSPDLTFHSGLPPWAGNIIDPPVLSPLSNTIIYVLASAGICSDTLPVPIQVDALPSFQLSAMPCDLTNNVYSVVFQSNAATISSSSGTVVNNLSEPDSIIDIPDGTALSIFLASGPGCADTIALQAPDCNCPSIPIPIPGADTITICENEAIPDLSVSVDSGLTANWYDLMIGGMLLQSGSTAFEPTTSITTTFYVEAVDTLLQCSSPRIPVTLQVHQAPQLEALAHPGICEGDSIDFSVLVPAIINGANGTGQWFNMSTQDQVTGITAVSDGEVFIYVFTSTMGSCSANDTIQVNAVEPPDAVIESVICSDTSATYSITITTNAYDFSISAGNVTQVGTVPNATFIASGIPIQINADITLSSSLAGMPITCDTSFTIQAPDCACPPLLIDSSFVLCSDPGTVDLSIFEDPSANGFWEFVTTPGGDPASISAGSLFDGSNASGGLYYLKFTSEIPLGECADSAFFRLTLVNPSVADLPTDTTICVYNDQKSITVIPQLMGSHVMTSWQSTGDGFFVETSPFEVEYHLGENDIQSGTVQLSIEVQDSFDVCTSDDANMDMILNTSSFIELNTTSFSVCDTNEESILLDDFIEFGPPQGYWIEIGANNLISVTDSSYLAFLDHTTDATYTLGYVSENATPPCNNDTAFITVRILDCSCTLQADATPDTAFICRGDSATFNGSITGAIGTVWSYWLTGTDLIDGQVLTTGDEGFFIFVVEDQPNCIDIDTVYVSYYEELETALAVNDPNCYGIDDGSIAIEAILTGSAPFYAQLDGGMMEAITEFPVSFDNLAPGDHQLVIMDGFGCLSMFDISLVEPEMQMLNIGPDQIIILGDSVYLEPALGFTPDSMYWVSNPPISISGFTGTYIVPEVNTLVQLFAIDENGCLFSDEVLITVVRSNSVFIPNVFSPNGDNINDLFVPYMSTGIASVLSFQIYNRWGEIVYSVVNLEPADPGLAWEGRYKGGNAAPGVYVYRIQLLTTEGELLKFHGDITLVR